MKQHRKQPFDFDRLEHRKIHLWQVIILCAACLVMIYVAGTELANILLTQAKDNP